MAKRPLAILTEGRLTESQVRALTLLSLGWIEVVYVVPDTGERRLPAMGGGEGGKKMYSWDRLKQEEEIIMSLISTFKQWQNQLEAV